MVRYVHRDHRQVLRLSQRERTPRFVSLIGPSAGLIRASLLGEGGQDRCVNFVNVRIIRFNTKTWMPINVSDGCRT